MARGGTREGAGRKPGSVTRKTQEELDLVAACKGKTPAALAVIESIMMGGENERNRLSAAQTIIERAYGKAKETVDVDANVSGRIETIVRRIVRPQ